MGPPEETPESKPFSAPHKYRTKSRFTSVLRLSACLYLFFHEVDTHTVLGYIFRHDRDNDLGFCLVPVMSARNTHNAD